MTAPQIPEWTAFGRRATIRHCDGVLLQVGVGTCGAWRLVRDGQVRDPGIVVFRRCRGCNETLEIKLMGLPLKAVA